MKERDAVTEIHTEQCFRRAGRLDVSELPDGYMVTDAKTGRVHYLNPVAAIIFELCDGKQSVAKITRLLERDFSLDEAPGAQVTSCLSTLLAEGLIAPCPP
jgi:hypothetical protein